MTSRAHFRGSGGPIRLAASTLLFLWIVSFNIFGFSMQTSAQGASQVPANPYGVNVFLHKEVEEWKIDRTLAMIAEANIPWVKQEFPWQEIEFEKGYFYDDKWQKSSWEKFDRIVDLADKHKLTIVARIDHEPAWAKASAGGDGPLKDDKDLADFINAFLDHYKGRIKYVIGAALSLLSSIAQMVITQNIGGNILGAVIAAVILFYLFTPPVKAAFGRS